MSHRPKRILFVCVENSNRSQMAEAFARKHAPSDVEIFSAGSRASGKINPRAIEFMREVDYDLTQHTSKSLDELPDQEYDMVILMGCLDGCPAVKAKSHEDWGLPDPKELSADQFREIRDLIETKVKDLFTRL